jgi:ribose/xylose/arabinose/galactoside ABC-type transport system permease subunit
MTDRHAPRRTWGQLAAAAGPFLAMVIVVAIFWGADSLRDRGGAFTTLKNFQTVCVHASPVAVAALGMLLIIIAGGIDLSVGAAIALAATVLAWCLEAGYPPWRGGSTVC